MVEAEVETGLHEPVNGDQQNGEGRQEDTGGLGRSYQLTQDLLGMVSRSIYD